MSDINKWRPAATANNAPSPNGFPELMARSGVNDSAREMMAAIRRFSLDNKWCFPFDANYDNGSAGYLSGAGTAFTGVINSDMRNQYPTAMLPMPCKATEGANTWYGVVTFIAAPFIIFQSMSVTWFADLSPDTVGPVGIDGDFMVLGDLGDACLRDTGTDPEDVPLVSDLDSHVFKAENTLDSGTLNGLTASQIQQYASLPNLMINGDMRIWQREVTFSTPNVDDVTADCWVLMADESAAPGTSVASVTRSADTPIGSSDEQFTHSAVLQIQNTASNAKSGLAQFVEVKDGHWIAGQGGTAPLSVSLWAKASGGIGQIRTYLINAKTFPLTTHPVTNYNSGATGDVTIDTVNWELVASASSTVTGTWTRFTPLENIDMDPTGAGQGVFALMIIMDDATMVNGDQLFLTGIQVNAGTTAESYKYMDITTDLFRAMRYYEHTYEWENSEYVGSLSGGGIRVYANPNGNISHNWQYRVPKYNGGGGATIQLRSHDGVATDGQWTDYAASQPAASTTTKLDRAHIRTTAGTANLEYFIHAECRANVWGNT